LETQKTLLQSGLALADVGYELLHRRFRSWKRRLTIGNECIEEKELLGNMFAEELGTEVSSCSETSLLLVGDVEEMRRRSGKCFAEQLML
jgi:hypothetical protein